MRLSTARDDFIAYKRDHNCMPATLRAYHSYLKLFIDHVIHETGKDASIHFTEAMVKSFFAHYDAQKRDVTRKTLACYMTAIREFAKWGLRKRYWAGDPVLDIEPIRYIKGKPRPFAPNDLERLMALPLKHQEVALRALLYYAGLREAEACGLRLCDLTPPIDATSEEQRYCVGYVHVLGKGDKERVIPIPPAAWEPVGALWRERQAVEQGDRKSPLLSKRDGSHWTTQMVRKRVHKWGRAAAVEPCVPHRFRHTFATDLFDADEDLPVVQKMLGHSSPATTAIYLEVRDPKLVKATTRLRRF